MGALHWSPSGEVLSGTVILRYQQALASLGFLPNTAAALDGRIGDQTERAVRAFQSGRGLPSNGLFDAATKDALDGVINALNRDGRWHPTVGAVVTAATRTAAAATGSNPKVTAIATRTGTVPVAEAVSKMIPPSSVAALQQMPADKVQTFLADLQTKAADIAAAQESGASDGTGKGTTADISAVPMVAPDGTVTSALAVTQTQPSWWDGLSSGQKVAVGVGAGVVGLGLIAAVVSMASGRRDNPGRRHKGRR